MKYMSKFENGFRLHIYTILGNIIFLTINKFQFHFDNQKIFILNL